MRHRPIELARDPDLRLALQAMQRAAHRARELAARTGTAIVIVRNGVMEHVYPAREDVLVVVPQTPSHNRDD
ncbi:MAG: hypothetical protein H6977_04015 [Gammaproteobacteria bacterium]|nr:hypothetical protein [Gammaproteobacteria bacterium]MCP5199154.1 hypothetical protein [Gammaproteobacteria bacterium]